MKKMNLKSLMFALVALFAASATMVFTSCGDDKDEPDSQSIIGQWELINVEELYGNEFNDVVFNFRNDGTYSVLTKDEGEWYIYFEAEYQATPIDSKTGKGKYSWRHNHNSGEGDYWFEGKNLVISLEEGIYRYKPTSGIKVVWK